MFFLLVPFTCNWAAVLSDQGWFWSFGCRWNPTVSWGGWLLPAVVQQCIGFFCFLFLQWNYWSSQCFSARFRCLSSADADELCLYHCHLLTLLQSTSKIFIVMTKFYWKKGIYIAEAVIKHVNSRITFYWDQCETYVLDHVKTRNNIRSLKRVEMTKHSLLNYIPPFSFSNNSWVTNFCSINIKQC